MVELLADLPSTVVGFRASGEVTKTDYDTVVFPEIKKQMDTQDALNYVFVINTDLENFTFAAWMSDAWLGLKEIAKWRRVAIVSDQEKIRKFTEMAGHILPGDYRGFTAAQQDEAVAWAAS